MPEYNPPNPPRPESTSSNPPAGEELRDRVQHRAEQAREQAKGTADWAKQKGSESVEAGKQDAASRVDNLGDTLHRTAEDLQNQNLGFVANYLDEAARGLDEFAGNIADQDLGQLMHRVENFARRQPGLFLGGAVTAGFLMARFLNSSGGHRPYEPDPRRSSRYPAPTSPETTSLTETGTTPRGY